MKQITPWCSSFNL